MTSGSCRKRKRAKTKKEGKEEEDNDVDDDDEEEAEEEEGNVGQNQRQVSPGRPKVSEKAPTQQLRKTRTTAHAQHKTRTITRSISNIVVLLRGRNTVEMRSRKGESPSTVAREFRQRNQKRVGLHPVHHFPAGVFEVRPEFGGELKKKQNPAENLLSCV